MTGRSWVQSQLLKELDGASIKAFACNALVSKTGLDGHSMGSK